MLELFPLSTLPIPPPRASLVSSSQAPEFPLPSPLLTPAA